MKVYSSEPVSRERKRVKVGIADYAVGEDGQSLVTSGLGSCVGIAVYDGQAGVAGLLHAMLPEADGNREVAKYADSGIDVLIDEMESRGAKRRRMVAKLAGGSTMFEFTSTDGSIGTRNVDAAREALSGHGISVVAEDVGGSHGRSLELEAGSGTLHVRNAETGRSSL